MGFKVFETLRASTSIKFIPWSSVTIILATDTWNSNITIGTLFWCRMRWEKFDSWYGLKIMGYFCKLLNWFKMKKTTFFYFFLFLCLFSAGCKKKSATPSYPVTTDLATTASGTYSGTYTEGSATFSGTVTIIRITSTTVNVEWIVETTHGPTLSGISVSDIGEGHVSLSGSSFGGLVGGKDLHCNFPGNVTFSGTKP